MTTRDVLHIITTIDRGGAENQLLVLIDEQVRLGYKVAVAAIKGNSALSAELNKLGVTFIDLTRKTFLTQIMALRQATSNGSLVHSHLPRAEIISSLAFLGKRNSLVITRHNAEKFWPKMPNWFSNLVSRIVINRVDAVIAISKEVERYLKDSREIHKKCHGKLKVVPYGISSNLAKDSFPESRPFGFRVGIAARLEPQKDLSTLIKAFACLKKESKNPWSLSIAGSGSLLFPLKQQVVKLGLSENIIFLGKVEDVWNFYKGIDVFVLSSRYEGFGLVLLEAMLERVPIISSDIPTSKEVLGEDYPAFFPSGDSCELAKVIELMSNPKFRSLACSKYEARLPLFSSKHMISAIIEVYQSI